MPAPKATPIHGRLSHTKPPGQFRSLVRVGTEAVTYATIAARMGSDLKTARRRVHYLRARGPVTWAGLGVEVDAKDA